MIVRATCQKKLEGVLSFARLRRLGDDGVGQVLYRGPLEPWGLELVEAFATWVQVFDDEEQEAESVVFGLVVAGPVWEADVLARCAGAGLSEAAGRAALDRLLDRGWLERVRDDGGAAIVRTSRPAQALCDRLLRGEAAAPPSGLPAGQPAGQPSPSPPRGAAGDDDLLPTLLEDAALRLSTKEAALLLGVEARTFRNYKKRPGFPQARSQGRAKTYGLRELVWFAREQTLALVPQAVPRLESLLAELRSAAPEPEAAAPRRGPEDCDPSLALRRRP